MALIVVLFESISGFISVGVVGLRTAPVLYKVIVDPVAIDVVRACDKVPILVVGFQAVIVAVPAVVAKLVDVIPTSTIPDVIAVRVSVVEAALPVTVILPVVIGGEAREVCATPAAAEGAEYALLFVVIVIRFTDPGENPEKVAEYGVDA